MIWVLYALGSAITFSFISALDKVLLQRYIPNSRVFIILVGFVQLLLAVCVLPLASFTGYGADDAAIAVGSGLVTGAYLILLFWAISLQDVSRVVPVASTYPIFVAILAQLFLGEELGVLAWERDLRHRGRGWADVVRTDGARVRHGQGPEDRVRAPDRRQPDVRTQPRS